MKTRERGYSLAEVLVATAIFAIIILAALMIYDRSNRVFKRGVESSNMQQNTRVAFEKLTADLRMTGFDFDRDGIPTGSTGGGNVYQQTDEQFEYIGPAAITIRGNLDYEAENVPCDATASVTENCDNGREGTNTDPTKSYESSKFPVVTTGNDEIVTYALVPSNQGTPPACDTATNCVQFYADTHLPRSSYPGGNDENLVQIKGVDLCTGGCNNPPYTLTRFTLERDQSDFSSGDHVTATPLATNIRSMRFDYYQDAQGVDPLKDLNNTTDVSTGATIKGEGQWKQNNPGGLVANREIRTKINSVRLTLVGMNEQEDRSYTDATETVNAVKNYRKYRLETLIAPRNIQKRGMREQDTFPPGAPQNVHVCTGYCGGVYVYWDAPAVSNTVGAPDQYTIVYGPDVASSGTPCEVPVFSGLAGYVFGSGTCGAMIPNTAYKFRVMAVNSYGSGTSDEVVAITPLNSDQSNAPAWATAPLVAATTNQNGKVVLTWQRPQTSVGSGAFSCFTPPTNSGGAVPGGNILPAGEVYGYLVQRAPASSPTAWVDVLPTGTPAVTVKSQLDTVTWADTTAVNCINYVYQIKAVELCAAQNAYNTTGNTTIGSSPWSPATAGNATSSVAPAAPVDLNIDQAASNASCLGASGQCNPIMSWPRVTTDMSPVPVPITVAQYKVYYRVAGTLSWTLFGTVNDPPAGPLVNFTGPVLLNTQVYEFQVTAVQCTPPSGESTPSPIRKWPCSLAAGANGTLTAVGAFDGNGSQVTPWLFDGDANVTFTPASGAAVASVTFRVYTADGIFKPGSELPLGPGQSSYGYSWTIDPSSSEYVTVTVVDTAGCANQSLAWATDEPQGCCLEPLSLNPGAIVFSAGTNYIDVYLRNICSSALALNGVKVAWDSTLTPGGAKLDTIAFPLTGGGTSSVSINSSSSPNEVPTAPPFTAPIAAGNGPTSYRIRITFTKNLSLNPIVGFKATYTNVTGLQSCDVQTPPAPLPLNW